MCSYCQFFMEEPEPVLSESQMVGRERAEL